VIAQVVADRLGVEPADVEVLDGSRHVDLAVDDRVRQLLVALLRRRRRRGRRRRRSTRREDRRGSRSSARRARLAPARGRDGALESRVVATGNGARARRDGLLLRTEPAAARRRRRGRVLRVDGFVADVAIVEIERETGRVTVLDYATVHDAGRLLNPLLAEGQVLGGLAHGAAVALFERHVYDDDGNLMTGTFVDYLAPTAPTSPRLASGTTSLPPPFVPLGAKGLGEGTTMSVPAAIANAVADALRRDDVEPPFTPGRVWELLHA
jgi:CO/xanthine dehydrogenase Mo-binding subunit